MQGAIVLLVILFVIPYVVGFVALAFWRQWWKIWSATAVMVALYLASLSSGDGPNAFAADAIPPVFGLGICTGLLTSVIIMTCNFRPVPIVAATLPLGYVVVLLRIGLLTYLMR